MSPAGAIGPISVSAPVVSARGRIDRGERSGTLAVRDAEDARRILRHGIRWESQIRAQQRRDGRGLVDAVDVAADLNADDGGVRHAACDREFR